MKFKNLLIKEGIMAQSLTSAGNSSPQAGPTTFVQAARYRDDELRQAKRRRRHYQSGRDSAVQGAVAAAEVLLFDLA
jgi:hypothetical protein